MKRYRRAGGFAWLMNLVGDCAWARMALMGLSVLAGAVSRSAGCCMIGVLLTIPLDLFGHLLMRRYDMINLVNVALDAAADCLIVSVGLGCMALRFAQMRLPAAILLVLLLSGLIERARRIRQAAL